MMSMDGITPRSTHSRTPITPDMPIYVSFRRAGRRQTQLWYEPVQQENVGHGTCHEVTSDAYRHIAHSAQRRVSVRRLLTYYVVSSTQRTSAVWLVARRQRDAQRISLNCTTITWRLRLEWQCGVAWPQALSRARAGMCSSGVATGRHRAAPMALPAVHTGAGARGAPTLARCHQASSRRGHV